MIKPKSGQVLPESPHSRVKILFVCDCGNEKEIVWKNYMTNHTKSCGRCKSRTKYNVDGLVGRKFGHLRVDERSGLRNGISFPQQSHIHSCRIAVSLFD
jgi:hypothetical protein